MVNPSRRRSDGCHYKRPVLGGGELNGHAKPGEKGWFERCPSLVGRRSQISGGNPYREKLWRPAELASLGLRATNGMSAQMPASFSSRVESWLSSLTVSR